MAKLVMIVDDDPDIREALGEFLELEGYATESATDGLDALRKMRAGVDPCVILLDLMMPVMDGFQFRAEQKQDPDLAGIPVVVITAFAGVDPKAIDVRDRVLKPFDHRQLLAAIRRHC